MVKKRVIQTHHISYGDPEITVKVTRGEHRILSMIQWYCKKFVSKGFIRALRIFIVSNKDRAEKLG
jgi:hypothetical protein